MENIVKLAHDLDMSSVAEGIESREQLNRLVQLKCDFGQGYYFGEALPARKVGEKLSGVGQFRSRSSRIASFAWNKIMGREAPSLDRGKPLPKPAPANLRETPRQMPAAPVLPPRPMAPRAPLVARAPVRTYSPTRVKPVAPREGDSDQSANDLLVAFKTLLAKNAQRARETEKD